jgi:hypothetical protein
MALIVVAFDNLKRTSLRQMSWINLKVTVGLTFYSRTPERRTISNSVVMSL